MSLISKVRRSLQVLSLSALAVACGDDDEGMATPDGGDANQGHTDAGADAGGEAADGGLSPVDCASTCVETLPFFCLGQTITANCSSNCALEAQAAERIGSACVDAYNLWFGCILTTYETNAPDTCTVAVSWYETHELPAEGSVCRAELVAFDQACQLSASAP